MKKKLKFNNTYDSGSVTFLIFKKKNKYIGICLEFDLIVQADGAEKARELIQDYAKVWHKNAVKNKLPEEVLNRPAPKKYWKLYEQLVNEDINKLKAEKETSIKVNIEPQPVLRYQSPYPNLAFA